MKRLKIEAIELKSSKLFNDINMEKVIEIEEIKVVEMKLENLKILTTSVNTLKNQLFQRIFQKILCLIEDSGVNKLRQRPNSVCCQFKTHNAISQN